MVKHFYSFIVETESLFLEIDSLEISTGEKEHLKSLAESHIHHSILDAILSELSPNDKKTFLSYLNSKNHNELWNFLHARIDMVETKIKDAAQKIKQELHKDLKEVNLDK